jgi:hypothetical protein
VEPVWKVIAAASLLLVVVAVARGRRRGDPPLKVLENALFLGLPLLVSFGRFAPVLRRLWLVGLVLVGVGMFWRMRRGTPRPPSSPPH